jgi:ferredoxin-thioredoxin reductase catalytic subunit
MKKNININVREINNLYNKLKQEAESSGYHLNPDIEFTKDLVKGLLINEQRFGYWTCPCRLASGNKPEDIDIICPCDYRDADLTEYEMCYCALYVSQKVIDGKQKIQPIPERRALTDNTVLKKEKVDTPIKSISKPIWRCKICGYLCGRDNPPEICPICKAKKERFERFI